MYIYIHTMSVQISSKYENIKHVGLYSMLSITEHVHNELNFDVATVSVESMEIMKFQMQYCVEEARSQ
jgi:hypothetical protein